MRRLNRRQFLTLTTSSAATLLLAHCADQPQAQVNFDAETPTPAENPSSVRSSRVVEFDLEAQPSSVTLGDRTANLFTYNGQVPGPRLEARPGDTVRIRFTNRLSEPTNLHYHGLHIPPTGTADNIYLNIGSGQTFNYEFTLPTDHPAGTFFYHPHLHGRVADQVFRGLGGIFVVRGALDEIPEVKAAQEEFVFLKDFEVDSNGQVPNANLMQVMQGREGSIVTVNGKANPTFSLPTGGCCGYEWSMRPHHGFIDWHWKTIPCTSLRQMPGRSRLRLSYQRYCYLLVNAPRCWCRVISLPERIDC